ncbi:MAG TPA: hypothetical protein VFV38_24130 [Ktedonobacteraceae bacterium]|nr:hypothetical protein [Ktedonobacteraceae bacterium]
MRPGDKRDGQLVSQWVWNLRLELGHQLHPDPVRTTEFAPAVLPPQPHTAPSSGYAPPEVGTVWKSGRFSGGDFTIQPDGTLHGPANQELHVQEQRREIDGSLRVVYAASIRSCRPCPKREQCQWNGNATHKPRQVSVLLHPLAVGSEPLLWHDWSRRVHRHACIHLLRHQRVEVQMESDGSSSAPSVVSPPPLSRAQRAHAHLSWTQRLARNASSERVPSPTIHLFGIPSVFARSLGLAVAERPGAATVLKDRIILVLWTMWSHVVRWYVPFQEARNSRAYSPEKHGDQPALTNYRKAKRSSYVSNRSSRSCGIARAKLATIS